ncbi:MAG: phosphatase PAP2 family protein [Clostridiales bacterium]|nr:phosphatase PAP2 family protein [Clostridiales bacterium]
MEFLQYLDRATIYFIDRYLHVPILDETMIFFTRLGDCGFVWILSGIILLACGGEKRKWGRILLITLAVTASTGNLILKPLFQRARPFDLLDVIPLIDPPVDYSFPSGHTSASFACAKVISAMNRRWGRISYVGSVLIAFSRMYLLVHYPSDIIGGALLGLLIAKGMLKEENARKLKKQ